MTSILLIEAKFYSDIADKLAQAAIKEIEESGFSYERVEVPGCFEIPAAIAMAHKYRDNDFTGYVALGCVIQGETRHFDFICDSVSQGVMNLGLEYITPVIFGLLTTNNQQQAIDRSGGKHGNKGDEAAITAIKMIDLVNNSSL